MWAKWTAFYNRAKSANAGLSLFDRARQVFLFVTNAGAAALIALVSRTWHWYWDTFSWAGVAIAFLVSWILIPVGFLLLGVMVRYWRNGRFWKSNADDVRQQSELARPAPLIDHDRSRLFLRNEIWKAKIIFAHGGGGAQVCLDFSSSSGGVGQGFWRACRRFQLRQIGTFTKDQEITLELMALDDSQPRRFWHWTVQDGGDVLVHTMHRCRLALIVDDRVADDFNFIVVPCHDDSEKLLLIGDNHFSFAREWREKDVDRERRCAK